MNFNEILDTTSDAVLETLTIKRAYNRNYQLKVREANRQANLIKRIERDFDFVLSYMHEHFYSEIVNFAPPVDLGHDVHLSFGTWLLVCANDYRDAATAYNIASINDQMTLEQFTLLFNANFIQEGDRYILRES